MTYMAGKLLSVETRNLGEPLTVAASIGATSLSVEDATTFDENGGAVTIEGVTYSYSGITVDPDTLILTAATTVALDEGVKVDVFPASPVKTALVSLEDGGDTIPATVPHTLLEKFADGTRDVSQAEAVTLERRGNYEFVLVDSVAEPLSQTSLGYVEGAQGVGLTESVTQMQDAQVTGQFGAAAVSADTITLGGVDLRTQIDAAPIGKLLSARLPQQGADLAVTTTVTKLFELNCGTVLGGRTYRAQVRMLCRNTSTFGSADRMFFQFRYTTDGTAPTVSSAIMDGGMADNSFTPSGNWQTFVAESEIDIASEVPLRIGFVADAIAGAGSYSIYAMSAAQSRPQFTLFDDGPSGNRNDAAITLTGGGTTRFVKTFNPTWAYASMNGNITTNPAYSDVGNSSTWGNGMFGAFGFNSSAIVAALAGASTLVSCVLKWRPRTRATAGGLDVRFLSHNYSSASAFETAWFPQQWDDISQAGDLTSLGTFANAAPGTTYSQSLGTTVFGQFKSGSRKGLAISNSLTPTYNSHPDGSGTFYSFGTYQPQLVFTYDGTS